MNEPVLSRLQHLMTIREGVENLSQPTAWHPAADWIDEDSHLLLLLDIPGVDGESLALHEDGEQVTISGERPSPTRLISEERPSGSFSRTLPFPERVVPQSGQASLVQGVLTVRFEKLHPTINVTSDEVMSGQ